MSVIGAPTVLGPILGPVLGGLIVSNFSWRWIFYINVPVGIVTLVLSSRFLKGNEEKVNHSFDVRGFALLSPGLAAAGLFTLRGGDHRQVHQRTSAGELRPRCRPHGRVRPPRLHARHPLLDLNLFRNRNFTIANICIFVMGATLYGSMFILPLYYQIAAWAEPVASRPPHGAAGHRGRPRDAQVRIDHRPVRSSARRPAGHPHHGGGHHPLRLRHVHERSVPVGRHPVRAGSRSRPVHDADHGGGRIPTFPMPIFRVPRPP